MSNANVINVGTTDFESTINNATGPVLVDFWAEWCGPCRTLGPTLESLAADYEDRLTVAKVNIDQNPELAQRFGVRSIPTMIVFKDGQPAEATVGAQPKAKIAELVDRQL